MLKSNYELTYHLLDLRKKCHLVACNVAESGAKREAGSKDLGALAGLKRHKSQGYNEIYDWIFLCYGNDPPK